MESTYPCIVLNGRWSVNAFDHFADFSPFLEHYKPINRFNGHRCIDRKNSSNDSETFKGVP
jgi:hypothetical protein